jgi:hypothetical protein
MKKTIMIGLSLLTVLACSAQTPNNYKSLDPNNLIVFGGDHIVYKGKTITLGPKAFFIDGQLSDGEASKYSYVYNSVNKAAEHLTDGTEESPMVLYLAPYVYWIDDPDDPAVRLPKNGQSPFGLIIKCEWLRFYGLSENAENVVLACNRGQTIGSQGNYTMFRFIGQGTSSENITFGNYCNIDLLFPLKPELNRVKRSPAIVQAQLIACNGDKIVARNTRFISRLNMMPFFGGNRALFDRCHFESTDDALNTNGVYMNSTFEFYGGKPFPWTNATGVVFLNCDIKSFTHGEQYFVKMDGQIGVVDTHFTTETATYLGWKDFPSEETRNYQYNVLWNGAPITISKNNPSSTVDMTKKPLLDAYRFVYHDKVIYNIYNLLSGKDDWDPMGMRDIVVAAEKENGEKYTMLPVQLLIDPALVTTENKSKISDAESPAQMYGPSYKRIAIETKKNSARLTAKVNRFGNIELKGEIVKWSLAPEYKSFAELKVSQDGMSCEVIPTNNTDETKQVIVTASTPSGLEAASVLIVAPSKLDPPKFISLPVISNDKNGKLSLAYKLDMKLEDQSIVTWSRCSDAKGSNPIEIAVSRMNKPLLEYELSAGDIGYYLMASVSPKHIRCDAGAAVTIVMNKPISAKDVKADTKVLSTDFRNVSTKNQPQVIPGFWTWSSFRPAGVVDRPGTTTDPNKDVWIFGEGSDGSANKVGLLQNIMGAKMLYTPVGEKFGDMKLSMTVSPFKYEGQGFSLANLYIDILIKFDNKTLTGYALRFIRTTKFHDAVDCIIMKYDNGKITEISKPVSTSCYRPTCNITVEVKGNKIIAHADSPTKYYIVPNRPDVFTEVNMENEIARNFFGGFGIMYYGGSTTMIEKLKAEWK